MKPLTELKWHIPIQERPTIMYASSGAFETSTYTFCLLEHWTLHIYLYHAILHTSEYTFELCPGSMLLIPPGVANTYEFTGHSRHHCTHFRYEGRHGYEGEGATTAPLAAFFDVSDRFARMEEGMLEMVAAFPDDPLRAEVRLWDILMDLRDCMPRDKSGIRHPVVRKLCHWIEQHLAEEFSIPALVQWHGYSHNHMNRFFRAEFGMTIGAYVVMRRMQRASYLLRHTTEPIKAVAMQVGFRDLQYFNKAVRRTFGVSPRVLRSRMHDDS